MTGGPTLLQMVQGFVLAPIIHTAARLSLADHLSDGPKTSAELAEATGTHGPSLHRLLRGLSCFGIVTQVGPDRFELAPLGTQLRGDVPDSIRSLVLLYGSERAWRMWGELEYGIRSGKVPSEHVWGVPTFEYFAQNPDMLEVFNAAMAEHTLAMAPELAGGYDFARFGTLVDIGGGNGTLLATILAATPGLTGVLYDLPNGLRRAAETLAAAGVADRCELVPGDFFGSVPEGAGAYLLKSVIHDWNDDESVAILGNCRKAMAGDGVVLVVEYLMPETTSPADTLTVMSDLNMLVATGGRERTEAQYRALFAAAGLELTEVAGPFGGYYVFAGRASSTE